MNASPITKITSWLEFLNKNLHLLGCATVCGKSEVMLKHILPMKKRNLSAKPVEKDLLPTMPCKIILIFILVKNHMRVKFVEKVLQAMGLLELMKEVMLDIKELNEICWKNSAEKLPSIPITLM